MYGPQLFATAVHVTRNRSECFQKVPSFKNPYFLVSSWNLALYAELNPICHLLALIVHHILHVSRVRVKSQRH
jgi:hypothetical protein